MTLDTALALVGLCLESLLLILLARKHILRALPFFACYLGFGVVTLVAAEPVLRFFPGWYLHFYLVNIFGDALLCLCTLVELGRSVLRCNRKRSSKWPLAALLFAPASLLIWPLASWTIPPHLSLTWILCFRMEQGIAILQVAAILTLAWWSSLLGLRWPDHELQVATGLSLFSLIELLVAIAHTHQSIGAQYRWLDQGASASYLGVLAYWVFVLGIKSEESVKFPSTCR